MRIAYFAHSLRSCWNHGNAHFLRGVLRELALLGHEVVAAEPDGAWSLTNLLADHGETGLAAYAEAYPELPPPRGYAKEDALDALLDGADLVLAHEWNEPWVIAALGRRRRTTRFVLLFHDTHHRAVSDPDALRRFDLSEYDGVLAFGEALAAVYRRHGWGRAVQVWHEAADLRLFRPPSDPAPPRHGLVWIGNWGDGERTAELEQFLLRPAHEARWPLRVHGVRYPSEALALLAAHDAEYRGWLANPRVPAAFAAHAATVHVPRRYYAGLLPGIPTIRVFEALACGIPLLCAPWDDAEGLFRPGRDYLTAPDGDAMRDHLRALAADPALGAALAASGLETVRARHGCAHRAQELLAYVARLRAPAEVAA